jgi:hypothetical protein
MGCSRTRRPIRRPCSQRKPGAAGSVCTQRTLASAFPTRHTAGSPITRARRRVLDRADEPGESTYRDASAVLKSRQPRRSVLHYASDRPWHPAMGRSRARPAATQSSRGRRPASLSDRSCDRTRLPASHVQSVEPGVSLHVATLMGDRSRTLLPVAFQRATITQSRPMESGGR